MTEPIMGAGLVHLQLALNPDKFSDDMTSQAWSAVC